MFMRRIRLLQTLYTETYHAAAVGEQRAFERQANKGYIFWVAVLMLH